MKGRAIGRGRVAGGTEALRALRGEPHEPTAKRPRPAPAHASPARLREQFPTIVVLDADPDLAAGLPEHEFASARRASLAAVCELDKSRWDPSGLVAAANSEWLGLLLVDGVLLRRVRVGDRAGCELFGPGDLIRPWDADGEYAPVSVSVEWLVLRRARLAVLNSAFALRMARWPVVAAALISRVAQRARYLALRQGVNSLPRTHDRLLLLFWLLAERWGRVSREGIRISLPLTHEVLATLIGAQRPTVTIALKRLEQAGLLVRERRDSWLMTQEAAALLAGPSSLKEPA